MESKLNFNKKNVHIIYFKAWDIINNTSSEGDV